MNVHPIFEGYLNLMSGRTNLKPTGLDDWFLIEEHKAVMSKYLNAALAEINSTASDFVCVDVDQYMTDWRASFDPYLQSSTVQDAFADAAHAAYAALKAQGFEPIARAKKLPSGASVTE